MRALSKREKIYVGVFVIALIWGIWNYRQMFFSAQSVNQPRPIAAVTGVTIPQTQPLQPAVQVETPNTVQVKPAVASMPSYAWDGDPFHRTWRYHTAVAKSNPSRKTGPPLRLTAVVVQQGNKYAVINGGIVREGGRVAGRTVKRIEESKVVVDDHGIEVTLSL